MRVDQLTLKGNITMTLVMQKGSTSSTYFDTNLEKINL